MRKYDAGNAQTEAEAEEVALEVGTLIDVAHLRDGAAEIVTGTSLRGESSIRTFPPVLLAEAVGPLDPPVAHVRARDLYHLPVSRRAGNAMTAPDDVDQLAVPSHRTEEIARGRGDAVLITVIEQDPYPAVILPAHVLPEETEDKDPFLPAHHGPPPLETDAEEGARLCRDRALDHEHRREPMAGGDHRLTQEMARENQRLILQRATEPATIAV